MPGRVPRRAGHPKVGTRPPPEAQLIRPSFATALEALSGLLHLNDVEPGAGQPGIHQAPDAKKGPGNREPALFPPCFFSVILPSRKLYKYMIYLSYFKLWPYRYPCFYWKYPCFLFFSVLSTGFAPKVMRQRPSEARAGL